MLKQPRGSLFVHRLTQDDIQNLVVPLSTVSVESQQERRFWQHRSNCRCIGQSKRVPVDPNENVSIGGRHFAKVDRKPVRNRLRMTIQPFVGYPGMLSERSGKCQMSQRQLSST